MNGDILSCIGNTPLLELTRIGRDVSPVRIYGKAEFLNPGGSVKDRAALNMVREGQRDGRLRAGLTLLDATSGNTGVAYAMIGAALGVPVKLCVPKNIGAHRRKLMEAYGAELVLTNAQMGSDGAILEAVRQYQEAPDRYFYADQYNNPANWQAHFQGTGEEIIHQVRGEITHFVAGLGTSGTFTGTGRRLREFYKNIQLISVEPDSPFHGLEGMKHMASSIIPGIYDRGLANRALEVSTEDAQAMTLRLAREEGLLVGMSSGAAVAAAVNVARELKSGVVVTILCDVGHRYLDMNFWGNR